MAKRVLQIDAVDNNFMAEIELEETVQFKVLLSKLKAAGHLNPGDAYFIKTPDGNSIRENDAIRLHKKNDFIITKYPEWKPISNNGIDQYEVFNISKGVAHDDNNIYWLFPFSGEASWNDLNLRTQLFDLEKIETSNGINLRIKMLVQYSVSDAVVFNSLPMTERVMKMKQILIDGLSIELASKGITDSNFYSNTELLTGKIRSYLSSHMELKWGTKIDCISIISFNPL